MAAETKTLLELKKELRTLTDAVVKNDHSVEDTDNGVQIARALMELLKIKRKNTVFVKFSVTAESVFEGTAKLATLMGRLPCSGVAEDAGVVKELWLLISGCPYARALFGQNVWCIDQLVNRTSVERSYSDVSLQGLMASMVFQISNGEINVLDWPTTMPFLIACLRSPTVETKLTAAAALSALSTADFYRKMIGESGAIKLLVELIKQGDLVCLLEAAGAIFNLCTSVVENREQAVCDGAVIALIGRIRSRILVVQMLQTLEVLSRHEKAIAELEDEGMLQCLFGILADDATVTVADEGKEYCMLIIHAMCVHGDVAKINEVENSRQTLQSVAITGTTIAREKAAHLLDLVDSE